MPELPEVEFARRCWERWAAGRRVTAGAASPSRVLRGGPGALKKLKGAVFFRFDRRGKNLLLSACRGKQLWGLWSHLGMTGRWLRRPNGGPAPGHARARLDLDSGHTLYYCDPRLFGRLQVVPGARFSDLPEMAALGPDPLEDGVNTDRLAAAFEKKKLAVKVAIMDQRVLAGLGNIQASEALFRARIDPRTRASALDKPALERLAVGVEAAVRETLAELERSVGREADIAYVEEPGVPNPFAIYGRQSERCPRCRRGTIARVILAGRSTYFCARCQR